MENNLRSSKSQRFRQGSLIGNFSSRWSFSLPRYDSSPKSQSKALRILICTCNIGNEKPTPESMAAFIPKLGSMDSVVQGKRNNVEFDTVNIFPSGDGVSKDKEKLYGNFDIIVIGMQEATFSSSDSSDKGETEDWFQGSTYRSVSQGTTKEESPSERRLLYDKSSCSLLENECIDDKQYEEKDAESGNGNGSIHLERPYENDEDNDESIFGRLDKLIEQEKHRQKSEECIEKEKNGDEEEKDSSEDIEKTGNVDENEDHEEEKDSSEDIEKTGNVDENEDHEEEKDSSEDIEKSGNVDENEEHLECGDKFEQELSEEVIHDGVMINSKLDASTFGKFSPKSEERLKKHEQKSSGNIFRRSLLSFRTKRKKQEQLPSTDSLIRVTYTKDGSDEKSRRASRDDLKAKLNNVQLALRSTLLSENNVQFKNGKYFANTSQKDSKILHTLVEERCPNHVFVVNYLHGAIRLMILVKKKMVREVESIKCKTVSTGIGSVLRNKGGIVATMTIRKTRLAFITAHLAAHEGEKYYLKRNQDITSILSGGKIGRLDPSLASHHCFIFGDLNYRLTFPPEDGDRSMITKKVVDLVNEENWGKLNELDELKKGLEEKEVMVGFKTPLCIFPPTFKLKRQIGFNYICQRVPSFTDRILWKSSPGLEGNVRPIVYEPIENFATSDHKPIRGAFHVDTTVQRSKFALRLGSNIQDILCWRCRKRSVRSEKTFFRNNSTLSFESKPIFGTNIYVSDMKCSDLKLSKESFKKISSSSFSNSSFSLTFSSDPEIMRSVQSSDGRSMKISTSMKQLYEEGKKNSESVTWGEEVINLKITDHGRLAGSMLFINLVHKQLQLIGSVVLNLEHVCRIMFGMDSKEICIDEPILKNGLIQGRLQCQLHVILQDFNAKASDDSDDEHG